MGKAWSFFLGANSPAGFYSGYDGLIDTGSAREVLILKGGPGCGKSSFLRRLGAAAEEQGADVEYIRCSSDPNSLDGMVISSAGFAAVDGTAPHVVEPKLPGAVDSYVDLGRFYDKAGLYKKREELARLISGYRSHYPAATRALSAARLVDNQLFDTVISSSTLDKLSKRAAGLISREIKGRGSGGRTLKRYMSAFTPMGAVCLFQSAETLCTRIYELVDCYGLSHFLLYPIAEAARNAGYDTVECYSPLDPASRIEHLLIPELSLGFVSSSIWKYAGKPLRRLHLDRALDAEKLRENRSRLKFLTATRDSLIDEGIHHLALAKEEHDRLEDIYNPYVDFDGLYRLAEKYVEHLMELL